VLIPSIAFALGVGVIVAAFARAAPGRAAIGMGAIALASAATCFPIGRFGGVEPALLALAPAAALAGALALPWPSRPVAAAAAAWAAILAAGAVCWIGAVRADGRPNRDMQVLAPDIERLVPKDAALLSDRTAVQGVVFYSRRRVLKAPGAFFRSAPLPDRLYGVFAGPFDAGIVGYESRSLASAGGLRLVELARDPRETMPAGPRVITRGDDPATEAAIRLLGATAVPVRKGGWVDYFVSGARAGCGEPLPREGWTLVAETPSRRAGRALDGSLATAWQAAAVQRSGTGITLDLGHAARVTCLLLETDSPRAFPHGIDVRSSTTGGEWTEVARAEGFHPGYRLTNAGLDFRRDYAVEIGFAPVEARYLRLSLTVDAADPWRIAELAVFAPP
jgi:F5/8 type C domain-containing protein